jgi:hypothetical protein
MLLTTTDHPNRDTARIHPLARITEGLGITNGKAASIRTYRIIKR